MSGLLSVIICIAFVVNLAGGPSAVIAPTPLAGAGEKFEFPQDELSPAQEQALWEQIQRNLTTLRSAGLLSAPQVTQAVTYGFPLRMAPGLPDAAGFRVSAFADHNPASGQVLDYNGGTRTYDGHRATDYALYPFSWNKLDAGEMQVVAAAAGTILLTANGDPSDHNCNVSSADPWNYVALVHADGRMTIYGHLRYNSLTTKGVGASVAQGEYLGTAGSSGNSSGPHLHFEVRYGSYSNAEWIDPYAGPGSQPGSLWAAQRPYLDSAINRVSTHSSPPSTPDACKPSIPNLKDSFVTPARVYFYAFYRDFQGPLPTQLKLFRPDGSQHSAWQFTNGTAFSTAWSQGWVVEFTSADPAGTWRFEATYNGQMTETFLNLNAPASLQLTSPNGAEQWDPLLPHSLTWADTLGGAVNLALYRNGSYVAAIAYNTPSDGEYLWTPGLALALGSGYTIRATSVINPGLYDESDAPFTLANLNTITARNDFALTSLNMPVTIYVLSNDEDTYHTPLSITAVGSPNNGTVNPVGATLRYTPAPGFLGSVVFSYTVSAGGANQTNASVTVRMVPQVYQFFLPVSR